MKHASSEAVAQPKGFFQREISQWFGNIIGDLWGGAVTTFALLPEVIGFMIVVGVHPYMGLFTCICLTVLLAFIGGRPGLISAGAGATALILAGLIKEYGLTHPEYIFATVILAGIIQFVLGICRVGSLAKYIPECVMHGFVNGFAIVILVSQLKLCVNRSLEMYLLIVAGILIICLFPLLKKVVPALKKVPESLIAIILITAYALIFRSDVAVIGDMGNVQASFQYVGYVFTRLGGIFSGECFSAIIMPAFSVAFVGLIESVLTAKLVDTETGTDSNKNRECRAQGIGNMLCGVVGAMPGCGMIAMTVTNLKSGGKGRLSQFVAGVLMAALLVVTSLIYPIIGVIPLAALCAVMFVVCFHTINWSSIIHINRVPIPESVVMILTAIIIIATDNLALGVAVGLFLFAAFYLLNRFVSGSVQMGLSYACFAVAAGLFAAGFFLHSYGFPLAILLSALGVGMGAMAREKAITQGQKGGAMGAMLLCIAMGVIAVAASSYFLSMGPWFHLIEAFHQGEASMLYVA